MNSYSKGQPVWDSGLKMGWSVGFLKVLFHAHKTCAVLYHSAGVFFTLCSVQYSVLPFRASEKPHRFFPHYMTVRMVSYYILWV